MIRKIMASGKTIHVVETHAAWSGPITEAKLSSVADAIDIRIALVLEDDKIGSSGFTIMQPDRWKLGKNAAGEWCLWPPRAKSRRK